MTPSIGVVIATPGRRTLLRTINSILFQGLVPGDDVLIVGDGYHKATDDLVKAVGAPFRYVATEQTRDWGHSQVNYGLQHVGGDWVTVNDDDDIFMPRAFDEMRTLVIDDPTPRVILGRVLTPYLGLLWKEPQSEPLDGHCIVVPNDKKKLGYFGLEYAGDQKWITSNIAAYDRFTWADRVWAFTRPTWDLWPGMPSNVNGVITWSFHRSVGDMPDMNAVAHLKMWAAGGRWEGTVAQHEQLEAAEAAEIAQFAAWAGQGHDVWLSVDTEHVQAGISVGYIQHAILTDYLVELVSEWPPIGCIPKRDTP